MDQRIINLYDQFTHGGMNRRDFLDRLASLAGSAAAGAALLPLLQNNYAQAAIVEANDARLETERVSTIPKRQDQRLSRSRKGEGQAPGHHRNPREPRPQPAHRGVARRLALEGFLTFAPDLLSLVGGTPPTKMRRATCIPR